MPGLKLNHVSKRGHRLQCVNSLVLGRCGYNFKYVIFKYISVIDVLNISCEIAMRWMPRDPHSWLVKIGWGNGLVLTGNKPLLWPPCSDPVRMIPWNIISVAKYFWQAQWTQTFTRQSQSYRSQTWQTVIISITVIYPVRCHYNVIQYNVILRRAL